MAIYADKKRTMSAEARAKISASMKGKTRPPEVRAKISASRKGMKMPEKTKEALLRANTGRTHTAESRAKNSESNRRYWATHPRTAWNKGLKMPAEVREKQRLSAIARTS